jgi:hypothetical protein
MQREHRQVSIEQNIRTSLAWLTSAESNAQLECIMMTAWTQNDDHMNVNKDAAQQ